MILFLANVYPAWNLLKKKDILNWLRIPKLTGQWSFFRKSDLPELY